jgi:hypothetical protein
VAAVNVLIHAATSTKATSQMECVMGPKIPPPGGSRGVSCEDLLDEKRSRETERMLTAMARAIVIGRLPPDDAFAWARIAAYEVKALGG